VQRVNRVIPGFAREREGMNTPKMNEDARIRRLRNLAAELERLPPSSTREELLREARHRAVALEVGVAATSAWRSAPRRSAPEQADREALDCLLAPRHLRDSFR